MFDRDKLFEVIRNIKKEADPKAKLTQANVDAVNAVIGDSPATFKPVNENIIPMPASPVSGSGLKLSPKGEALIHSFESLKLVAYKDPGSKNGLPITNGWGTTVDEDGGPIPLGAKWDRAKADRLFRRDIVEREKQLNDLLGKAPTTQNQFDALMSFMYNIGKENFKTSTLRRMHLEGNYAGAKLQFARWNKNDGKIMNGLVRRRAEEALLYGTP